MSIYAFDGLSSKLELNEIFFSMSTGQTRKASAEAELWLLAFLLSCVFFFFCFFAFLLLFCCFFSGEGNREDPLPPNSKDVDLSLPVPSAKVFADWFWRFCRFSAAGAAQWTPFRDWTHQGSFLSRRCMESLPGKAFLPVTRG